VHDDLRAGDTCFLEQPSPHVPKPPTRPADVVRPERVTHRQEYVEPDLGAGRDQHGAAAAATVHHVHAGVLGAAAIDGRVVLGAAEDNRRPGDLADLGETRRRRARDVDPMETGGRACSPVDPPGRSGDG
jgi:hypothetical protein